MSSKDTTPPCGHTNTLPDHEYAQRSYSRLAMHQFYFTWQNAFTQPNADTYAKQLLTECPTIKPAVQGKLAIVTGVTIGGAGYHMAEELALSAGMDVILMGRTTQKLTDAEEKIKSTAKERGAPEPKLYHVTFDLNDLSTAVSAAKSAAEISKKEEYGGKIAILVNNAGRNTVTRQLTKQGVEVNTGQNFLATHKLTMDLLPYIRAAKTEEYTPRVLLVASAGHIMGTDFDPARLVEYPDEGGSPEGYMVSSEVDGETTKTYKYGELMGSAGMYMYAKYAVVADAIAFAKREKGDVAFFSIQPGSIASNFGNSMGAMGWFYYKVFGLFQFSPSQGAISTLRAALDPTVVEVNGAYLDASGNPWPPRDPSGVDPKTGEVYEIGALADAVYEAANQLCQKLLPE